MLTSKEQDGPQEDGITSRIVKVGLRQFDSDWSSEDTDTTGLKRSVDVQIHGT